MTRTVSTSRAAGPKQSPDRSTAVERVIAEVRLLGTELDRLDAAAARTFGLNRTDSRALDVVHRIGSVSPTDLSKELGLTTGGVTAVLDRLEASGFISRRPHPSDRRQLVVEPSSRTERLVATTFGPLAARTRRITEGLSAKELVTIGQFLTGVREATAARADELMAER
jgi:DNA-binding MarR family transcriptional regulator